MKYAKEGIKAIIREPKVRQIIFLESDFEESVYKELTKRGWDLTPQVGVSGYRIDLAVKNPDKKGEFILGIECDGSAYHSSKVARDRDRIRQDVLENLGWEIHRIWSLDWLYNREREVEKIENKLNFILKGKKNPKKETKENQEVKKEIMTIDEIENNAGPLEFSRYKKVSFRHHYRGLEAFNYSSYHTLKNDVITILKEESPIHEELLMKRIIKAWGLSKIGANIRRKIRFAISSLTFIKIVKDGKILWYQKKKKLVPVRISTDKQRPFELIPVQESGSLAIELLKHGFSIEKEDLILEMARYFGYKRKGPRIQKHLEKTIDYLKKINKIKKVENRIELI